ncbi:MAG TPA: TonB family protein, partial [Polyangiaceae bacterium]
MTRRRAWLLALGMMLGASPARAQEGTPSGATPSSEGKATVHLTKAPKLVHFEQARFPAGEARASTVVLALTIGRDGTVGKADILQSGGPSFDAAAQQAALHFVFEPAEIDGRPAAVKIRYAYSFTPAAARPAPVAGPPAPVPTPSSPPEAVTVRGAPRRPGVTDVTVSAEQASKVAGTQGDPIKVLENLPGLARPSFGSGALIVWGASPGETRTLVDGVEVPALFHGSALRSTVNGDLVKSVRLTPGAYGADYGRAIGGMVRVETKDLPETGVHGYVGADTLDASAMATATLGARVRVGVAGRYGWLDRVLQAVDAPNVDQYFAIPRYADGQVKMQVALRPRESLDMVLLESTDALSEVIPDADPARVRSESTTSGFQRFYLHYRRLLDDGGYVDVVPYFGRDESTLDAHFGENPATLDEYTRRYGVRASHRAPIAP